MVPGPLTFFRPQKDGRSDSLKSRKPTDHPHWAGT
jgi:hypothetical protein